MHFLMTCNFVNLVTPHFLDFQLGGSFPKIFSSINPKVWVTMELALNTCCVSSPKQQRTESVLHIIEAPVLAQDVSRVVGTGDVVKSDKPGCNCLSNTMERQGGVSLVKLGMEPSGAVDN